MVMMNRDDNKCNTIVFLQQELMDDGKGNVNCIIERKTANQIIASEPKKVSPRLLVFVNLVLVLLRTHFGNFENILCQVSTQVRFPRWTHSQVREIH